MPNENVEAVTYRRMESGEFAGWHYWPHDRYEMHSGPYFFRRDAGARVQCAFRVTEQHLNGGGTVHGGCLVTFADYSLFAIAQDALAAPGTRGITVSLNSEFIGAALAGDLVEATGEVIRAGGSLIFVRGLVTANGKPALNFSGVIKKLERRGA
jgi:uncharacterized protein (TIGR00369 family)